MIEYEPDAVVVAQTNLTYWEKVNKMIIAVHHPEIQNDSEDMIRYNQSILYISAHEDEDIEPIGVEE